MRKLLNVLVSHLVSRLVKILIIRLVFVDVNFLSNFGVFLESLKGLFIL